MLICAKRPPTPCLWQAPASTTQKIKRKGEVRYVSWLRGVMLVASLVTALREIALISTPHRVLRRIADLPFLFGLSGAARWRAPEGGPHLLSQECATG